MKRAMLTVLVLMFALAGCGGSANPSRVHTTKTEKGFSPGDYRQLDRINRAYYHPTELGRTVVCLSIAYDSPVATESCDWAQYHHQYGWGDPYDQKGN